MPRTSGIEATERIRATPGLENLPIVACTASAQDEDRENALSAGCNEHIAKPVELETMATVLGSLLPIEWRKQAKAESG
jgi:CheY-like chemotaxis protein